MARSDRLFRLMHLLRSLPPPVTAERLARETGVSVRSLYRDIDTLRASGARIEGESGYGYTLAEDPALPPQAFTRLELEAVLMGLQEVRQSGDTELGAAAETAMAKLVARLPDRQQMEAHHAVQHLWRSGRRDIPAQPTAVLRQACWDEVAVDLEYSDKQGRVTQRRIYPMTLVYMDEVLNVVGWCCLRQDYREFRTDRILSAERTDESFRPRRVAMLREFVERVTAARAAQR
ncbi:helix-turn-helix transcriptional regulator [Pelagovum pacificum]|uniref:YafY family transcriptional regulator n=1 Tax=Pelagovum pacificum TaxID=2588711 RepID=A0A5C5GIX0_9RHOB|nr:YafY family protein [Pelagovum pacificum]QQA43034.1 YafY family transcriptional regulator [Pelagovum pacificum]TNY33821.1 YafY family transcriptional regulator [Pelagovum pacificum]